MDNVSPVMSSSQQANVPSLVIKTSEKFCDPIGFEQQRQDNDCLIRGSFPCPFSQSENLPTASVSPLVEESFWSQNLQDLGICEDFLCQDNFNILDVDVTFRNFEEPFGTEQDPDEALLDEKDMNLDISHDRISEKMWILLLHREAQIIVGKLDSLVQPCQGLVNVLMVKFHHLTQWQKPCATQLTWNDCCPIPEKLQ